MVNAIRCGSGDEVLARHPYRLCVAITHEFGHLLGVPASSDPRSVDYAVANRKDARKTAKELDLAQEQTATNRSVPLTMMTAGYKALLTYKDIKTLILHRTFL